MTKSIRKILSGLLAVLFTAGTMLCSMPGQLRQDSADLTAYAEDLAESDGTEGITEGIFEDLCYTAYADHVEITGYQGEAKRLTIPAEIDGLPVTAIGKMAFSTELSLMFIELPDTLTTIDAGAFYACMNLQEIVIPEHVTQIGDCAFLYCQALEQVTIPESVTTFGECVFLETPWLAQQRLENPLLIVNHVVLDAQTCTGKVDIPADVTDVTGYAFRDSKVTDVTIPEGVPAIKNCTFTDCQYLQSVTVPDSVTRIENRAFSGCKLLVNINIPDGVTVIGEEAFSMCTALEKITVPASVTEMGMKIFSGCRLLHDVILQDGLESVGIYMFDDCVNLENISVPVTVICNSAFSGCENLRQVEFTGDIQQIDSYAFGSAGITEITIPETVTEIGEMAFAGCEELKKIVIENSDCVIRTRDGIPSIYQILGRIPPLLSERSERKWGMNAVRKID